MPTKLSKSLLEQSVVFCFLIQSRKSYLGNRDCVFTVPYQSFGLTAEANSKLVGLTKPCRLLCSNYNYSAVPDGKLMATRKPRWSSLPYG